MDIRVELMKEYEEGESISALAEVYGIARKTIYKWVDRYALEGAAGLAHRRRAGGPQPAAALFALQGERGDDRADCGGAPALEVGTA